jgi:hypothetical protein
MADIRVGTRCCRWLEGVVVCPQTMVAMSKDMVTEDMDFSPFKGDDG